MDEDDFGGQPYAERKPFLSERFWEVVFYSVCATIIVQGIYYLSGAFTWILTNLSTISYVGQ